MSRSLAQKVVVQLWLNQLQESLMNDPRDYFAAQAMTWFLTELSNENMQVDPDEPPAMPPDLLRQFAADHAYKMADAMMKARGV